MRHWVSAFEPERQPRDAGAGSPRSPLKTWSAGVPLGGSALVGLLASGRMLIPLATEGPGGPARTRCPLPPGRWPPAPDTLDHDAQRKRPESTARSEERRVGKECRSRWAP